MPLDEVGGQERTYIIESRLQLSMVRSVTLWQNVTAALLKFHTWRSI